MRRPRWPHVYKSCLSNCSSTSVHLSEHFPQCLAQPEHNRSLIMSVTWKLNQPFDAQVRCFLQTLIICNYVNTLSHHSLVTKIVIIIGYPSWTRCFMNFISNATVFNSMGNCWMFIVCQALGYCPQFTSEQNKAPTLSDLLEWWIWTEDRGLFDAKAHILCSAHPTFPVGAHLLTVQLY